MKRSPAHTSGWSPPMSKNEIPSPELLRQLLRYEPDTGKLFWLPRNGDHHDDTIVKWWNTRNAGKETFLSVRGQYYSTTVWKRTLYAHRVAWAIQTGAWPEKQIDHINMNKLDNRFANLRQASQFENMRNQKAQKRGVSKYKGVSWDKRGKKWRADIGHNRQIFYLGLFDDEETAARAYNAAAFKFHGKFARYNVFDGSAQ